MKAFLYEPIQLGDTLIPEGVSELSDTDFDAVVMRGRARPATLDECALLNPVSEKAVRKLVRGKPDADLL